MIEDQAPSPSARSILTNWFNENAVYCGTVASGILVLGGLWIDMLSIAVKLVLCLLAVMLAAVSFYGYKWRAKRQQSATERALIAEKDAAELREKLDESAPASVLDTVANTIFVTPGAWRLTLFVLEPTGDSWCLKPLITRASSEVFEASPHVRISLAEGPLREIIDVDVNDPLRPFGNVSANLPDRDVDPDSWRINSAKIIQRVPDADAMATRKFGWTVLKEAKSRRTVVLLSESVLPDGIRLDAVRSQLLAPTVALISRMSGVSTHVR